MLLGLYLYLSASWVSCLISIKVGKTAYCLSDVKSKAIEELLLLLTSISKDQGKGAALQMKIFQEHNSRKSQAHKDIYAAYELAYTLVDLSAALLFVIGSVMFFYDSWQIPGTWCFLIGSILFGVKPTLRFVRELHYLAIGRKMDAGEQAPD